MSKKPEFKYIDVSGSYCEIGSSLGRLLKSEIHQTYNLYISLFERVATTVYKQPVDLVRNYMMVLADYFSTQVKQHLPHLHEEICSYAEGCGLSIQQLYILNSRTEIFHSIKHCSCIDSKDPLAEMLAECTALYSSGSNLLAQNWDWMPELENLCPVLKISAPGKPQIITFTEPGIIGKIGINSAGLAVCLNILFSHKKVKGLPTHILLRAILECKNVPEALELISKLPVCTSSNIMIADKQGEAVNLEINGSEITKIRPDNKLLIHTNHYLDNENEVNSTVPGSVERLSRAKQIVENQSELAVNQVKSILADDTGAFPICRSYAQGTYFLVGTVAATIADLNQNTLSVCKGQPVINSDWSTYSF